MTRDRRTTLIRVARTCGFTLLGVLLATLNVFNLRERSEDISASAFYALVAPFYSKRLANEPVVILYTKDALDRISKARSETWTWPLSFDQQALLLDNLNELNPCSIFFDIGFYQQRGDLDKFTGAIRNATAGTGKRDCGGKNAPGPGLLLIADLTGVSAEASVSNVFGHLVEAGAKSVPVTWSGRENTYPVSVDGKFLPAAALWTDWCKVTNQLLCPAHAADDNPHQDAVLSLTWGIGVSDRQHLFSNVQGCEVPVATAWQRFTTFFRRFWGAVGSAVGIVPSNFYLIDCPYALTIPADWIVLGIDPADLAQAIGGHMVLVGATLPGMTDFKPSPVNGSVAGVFLHAEALDNFLRFGWRDSWLSDGNFLWIGLHVLTLSLATYILLCFEEFLEEHSLAPALFLPAWQHLPRVLAFIALGFAAAATFTLLAAAFFFALDISPINWLGIATLLFVETARSLFPALFLIIFALLAGRIFLPLQARRAKPKASFEEEAGSG